MIFGRPGSGKSTFAFKLHKETGLPLYHLDKYFYEANWIERNHEVLLKTQQAMVDQNGWIIDGNSIHSLEMRYSKAHLVLYFNYPRWRCYWRILKRYLNKNPHIDDRAEGCPETVRFRLLRFTWHFEKRVETSIRALKDKYPTVKFVEIRSDKDVTETKLLHFQGPHLADTHRLC